MTKTKDLAESGMLSMAPVDPIPSGSSRINVGPTERYVSAGAGALLAVVGLRNGGLGGLLLAAFGGALIYRGSTGYCPVNNAIGRDTSEEKTETDVLEISESVTINKPREEVYLFWRQLENLPQFMQHLESVTQQDDKRSHWVAKISTGNQVMNLLPGVAWDAEILEDEQNSRLVWRSVPGATVDNSGEVWFMDAPGNQGTEVHAIIKYRAPEGIVGEAVMKLFNPTFRQMVKGDILRFKQLLEEGESVNGNNPTQHKEYKGVVL